MKTPNRIEYERDYTTGWRAYLDGWPEPTRPSEARGWQAARAAEAQGRKIRLNRPKARQIDSSAESTRKATQAAKPNPGASNGTTREV